MAYILSAILATLIPRTVCARFCSHAKWDAIHPPAFNGAGVLAFTPFPTAPIIPAALGANALGAAIALRKRQHSEYIAEIQAAHDLKDSPLSGIGVDNCRLLADALTGVRLISCRDICTVRVSSMVMPANIASPGT